MKDEGTGGQAELQIDEGRLAAKVEAQLREADIFAAPRTGAAVANVSIEVEGAAGGKADAPELGVEIRLRISVRPVSPGCERFSENVAAIGQTSVDKTATSETGSPLQRLAERTAEDLLDAYIKRQKLWRADEGEIARVLASDDNDLRLEALRLIGERKLSRLASAVLLLLTDDDEAVRDAALGALVAMKERRAIKALADSRHMRDTREMGKVLDAIGTLGGQEAEEYLSFVAETHDDESIRGMAKEALERLRRRSVLSQPTK